jgi:hypothetical protein
VACCAAAWVFLRHGAESYSRKRSIKDSVVNQMTFISLFFSQMASARSFMDRLPCNCSAIVQSLGRFSFAGAGLPDSASFFFIQYLNAW